MIFAFFASAELFAEFAAPRVNVIVPVAVGTVVGMGIVGLIHYLIRPRMLKPVPGPEVLEPETSDPFLTGSGSEKRTAHRRHGNPVDIMVVKTETKEPPFKAHVLDRSLGGLRVLSETRIDAEAKISVRPLNVSQFAPWVELIVKSSKETDIGYELGCQFVRQPTYAIILMFG
jgi:hypothetical protein